MLTDQERARYRRPRGTWLRDGSGYVRDWVGFVVIAAVGVVAIGVFIVVGNTLAWHARHLSCAQLQAQSGYDTRMVGSWFAGDCYVRVGDRWVPDSRYRMTDTHDAG